MKTAFQLAVISACAVIIAAIACFLFAAAQRPVTSIVCGCLTVGFIFATLVHAEAYRNAKKARQAFRNDSIRL